MRRWFQEQRPLSLYRSSQIKIPCPLSSVDGIGAYDTISRNARMRGLRHKEGGEAVLLFVLQFYGAPSTYLWEDSEGGEHEILQGEGGEQGDALMPALFALRAGVALAGSVDCCSSGGGPRCYRVEGGSRTEHRRPRRGHPGNAFER